MGEQFLELDIRLAASDPFAALIEESRLLGQKRAEQPSIAPIQIDVGEIQSKIDDIEKRLGDMRSDIDEVIAPKIDEQSLALSDVITRLLPLEASDTGGGSVLASQVLDQDRRKRFGWPWPTGAFRLVIVPDLNKRDHTLTGWLPCVGQRVPNSLRPELSSVLAGRFNNSSTGTDEFRVPSSVSDMGVSQAAFDRGFQWEVRA